MANFINTMFVHNSPPQPYSPPKPLPALHTNFLAESESCLHLSYPESPQSVYQSPLQRHIQNVFDTPPAARSSGIPVPVRQENRQHEAQQPAAYKGGLGFGLAEEISKKTDLLTRSDSNARNRNQQTAFQPQKRAKGTNSWQLKQFAEATLGSGSLRKVVQLPEGEDRDEWLAVNGTSSIGI